MNYPELFWNSLQLFFGSFWKYLGLIILILVIRGDVSRGIDSIRSFFHNVKLRYRERVMKVKAYEEVKKNIPKEVKGFAKLNTEKEA